MCVRFLGSPGSGGVCVELILKKREKRGPRLGQGKMSRALEVRKDEEKDGGEEGAHEKVSKIGLKEKRGGLWESVWRVHDVA